MRNDNFASAQVLSGGADTAGQIQASTVSATKQAGEPNPAGTAGAHSIWYSITPAASGQLRVDTCGSDFDTVLGVRTGSAVGSLTPVSDNDDSCGKQSAVVIPVNAGTKYSIEVDGHNNDWGEVALEWWLAHDDMIVSTSWSTAEAARLQTMGTSLGPVTGPRVPKVSTYTISYLLGFVSSTPTPLTPPAHGSDVTYTDFWTPSEVGVLNRATNKFVLGNADAVTYCTKVVDYLLSLGGH